MDIYSIGEEKCIDGVWGREVDGRFYTHYELKYSTLSSTYILLIYRKLDAETNYEYWLSRNSCSPKEIIAMGGLDTIVLHKYIPEHIKYLENLKCGDRVWVLDKTDRGDEWHCTTFVGKISNWYVTADTFIPCGSVLSKWKCSHKEVYLKPPFSF